MTDMNQDTYAQSSDVGEVQIANEVVAGIAGISASEIEGVESMAGGFTKELADKLGVKSPSKGVKVVVENDTVTVDLAINMKYGYSIPKTCAQVQEKVAQAINAMTGLNDGMVNVRIAGVSLEQE